jgi:PAS domain S-box-containing protein
MHWQSNPYFIYLIIAGLISLIVASVVAQRRRVAGSLPLLGMLLAAGFWCFVYSFELANADQASQVLLAKIEYIGIVCVPTFFLLFALEYAQHRNIQQRGTVYLTWVIPLVILALVWTNESHGLIWSQISQKDVGGTFLLSVDHGFAFWIWTVYSYLLLLVSSILLMRRAISSPPELKPQSFILVFGALITWAGNIIYLGGLSPVPNLDLTPITFIASLMIYSVGLFRFGILDIMPIAGETVLESLDDIVIMLDDNGIIAFINKAFEYYTGIESKNYVGQFASAALSAMPALTRLDENQVNNRGEVVLTVEGRDPVYFDTRVSTVRWKNQRLGRVYVLEDISERRRAEKTAFGQSDDALISNEGDIPMIFVLRMVDEKIVEVNRSSILVLGYERKDVVGRSFLQLGIWDAYQRSEFLKIFRSEGSVKNHSVSLVNIKKNKQAYLVSASKVDILDNSYIVLLAQLQNE